MTVPKIPKIVIIGAMGVFGERLVRHLIMSGLEYTLIITSRSQDKADRLAQELAGIGQSSRLVALALDHRNNLKEVLDHHKPFVVVDCSGPFQKAGLDTARTVIEAGCHFIDIADARDYLFEFREGVNALAQRHQVTALCGASSTPTISYCATRSLTEGWTRMDSLDFCITPGGKSEVGLSVIRAMLEYAGTPVTLWRQGRLEKTIAWLRNSSVLVPGLGKRNVAPVDTVDAELLSSAFSVRSRVSFSAGLESFLEQRGMQVLAALRCLNLLPNLKPLAKILQKFRIVSRITTGNRGGMVVTARGLNDEGDAVQAQWNLLTQNDHGPFVPITPVAAAIKKLISGEIPSGARMAFEDLTLKDIDSEMAFHDISTQVEAKVIKNSIFEIKLGEDGFSKLASPLQRFHGANGATVWEGRADIEAGWWLPRLIGKIFGFPPAGTQVPVVVSVDRGIEDNGTQFEKWERNFNGQRFSSVLRHEKDGVFTEQFGPFKFSIDLAAANGKIHMPVGRWWLAALPMPKFLAPLSEAVEFEDEQGRFRFDVRLSLPILGQFAHYKGWLKERE